MSTAQTCESPGFIRRHGSQVTQITLVPHQHDDDVIVRVIPQLLQPAFHVLVCQVLGNIVHQESPDSTAVVAEIIPRELRKLKAKTRHDLSSTAQTTRGPLTIL